jgi:hypothetical protein
MTGYPAQSTDGGQCSGAASQEASMRNLRIKEDLKRIHDEDAYWNDRLAKTMLYFYLLPALLIVIIILSVVCIYKFMG